MNSKLINSIKQPFELMVRKPKILNWVIKIKCGECGEFCEVKLESVYKWWKRHDAPYNCKSCAGKKAWDDQKRIKMGDAVIERWKDPNYAGTIIGKLMAHDIKKLTRI